MSVQLDLDFSPPKKITRPGGRDRELEARASALLLAAGCPASAGKVRVVWSRRMRTTAGVANIRDSIVTLNSQLVDFQEEAERTLLHELAHLAARERSKGRRIAPHGPEWRRACRDLGIPDEKRCHTLPFERRTVTRRHFYRCNGCNVEVGRVRPFRRRVACLSCCRLHNGGKYDERFRLVKQRAG